MAKSMIAGREFNDSDRRDGEKVVIISESVAKRMFLSLDAVNRKIMWTDPATKFIGVSTEPRPGAGRPTS
jgi:putative ABC transport system permease protein